MIQINFDIVTGVARLAQTTTIKVGGPAPVRIVFSAAPGTVDGIQLALGTDAAPPEILAFVEDFTEENETTWTALLDANDARLVEFMAAKGPTPVNVEVACTLDAVEQIAPNVSLTVQPRIITPGATTEGGPSYYTEAEIDAMLPRFLPTVTGYTGGGSTKLDGLVTAGRSLNVVLFVHATDGLRGYQLTAGTDAESSPAVIRPDDYHATTNAFVWKSVF